MVDAEWIAKVAPVARRRVFVLVAEHDQAEGWVPSIVDFRAESDGQALPLSPSVHGSMS